MGRMLVRRRTLAALAALLAAGFARAEGIPARFDPARDATSDLAQALRRAQSQGTRVMVDVGGEWCKWCHIMDRFVASHPKVRTLADRYVWVKVNWSPENRNQALLARWPKIAGYPHLFVLDAGGALLHSQDTGLLERGQDYDEDRFVDFLARWAAPR